MSPKSRLAVLAVAALAGCVMSTDRGPEVTRIDVNGTTYPAYAVSGHPDVWQVLYEGQMIQCTKPDEQSCYWSVRNYIASKTVPDMI